jgi:hypothetical protein
MAGSASNTGRFNPLVPLAVVCAICGGPALFRCLAAPSGKRPSEDDDGSPDPHLVLVTPVSGPAAGKSLYILDWDDGDHFAKFQPEKVAERTQIRPDLIDDFGTSCPVKLRVATLGEIKAARLPFHKFFNTSLGLDMLDVKLNGNKVRIRETTSLLDMVCVYKLGPNGPTYERAEILSSGSKNTGEASRKGIYRWR